MLNFRLGRGSPLHIFDLKQQQQQQQQQQQ